MTSLQSPRLRATGWHCPAAAGARSLHTLKSLAGISPSTTKTQLKQMDSLKSWSLLIHNNAHQHQTNKSCWETWAFCQHPHQGQVGNKTPVYGTAEPEAAEKVSREGSPSAGFFLSFATAKSQTSFDS